MSEENIVSTADVECSCLYSFELSSALCRCTSAVQGAELEAGESRSLACFKNMIHPQACRTHSNRQWLLSTH